MSARDGGGSDSRETVSVCPGCDDPSSLYFRSREADTDWVCKACGREFDDPKVRPSKGGQGDPAALSGALRKLWEMEPDDLYDYIDKTP